MLTDGQTPPAGSPRIGTYRTASPGGRSRSILAVSPLESHPPAIPVQGPTVVDSAGGSLRPTNRPLASAWRPLAGTRPPRNGGAFLFAPPTTEKPMSVQLLW